MRACARLCAVCTAWCPSAREVSPAPACGGAALLRTWSVALACGCCCGVSFRPRRLELSECEHVSEVLDPASGVSRLRSYDWLVYFIVDILFRRSCVPEELHIPRRQQYRSFRPGKANLVACFQPAELQCNLQCNQLQHITTEAVPQRQLLIRHAFPSTYYCTRLPYGTSFASSVSPAGVLFAVHL